MQNEIWLFARPLTEAGKAKWEAKGGEVRAVQRKRDGVTIYYRVLKEGTKVYARYQRQLDRLKKMREMRKKLEAKGKPSKKTVGKKVDMKKHGLGVESPENLAVDPKRFQFKMAGEISKTGEVGSLEGVGVWDNNLSGIVQVWHDPADGKDYVVNGHNRVALAKKMGAGKIAIRYIAANDAKEARAIGALTNIAEGHGTAVDAGKFFRDSNMSLEEMQGRGLPMRQGVVQDGLALSQLPKKIFERVIDGEIPTGRAVKIGESGLSHGKQESLLGLIETKERGRPLSNETIGELIDSAREAETSTTFEDDLFGGEDKEIDTVFERAKLQSSIKRRLRQEKKLFGTVARKKKQLESAGGGMIDEGKSREISDQATRVLGVFDQMKNTKGDLSLALNEAAKNVQSGGDRKKIEREVYRQVLKNLESWAGIKFDAENKAFLRFAQNEMENR